MSIKYANKGLKSKQFFSIPEYTIVIGGYTGSGNTDTVEVVSPDPISNPVPDCLKALNNFPNTIFSATGTIFGKLTVTEKNKVGQVVSRLRSIY